MYQIIINEGRMSEAILAKQYVTLEGAKEALKELVDSEWYERDQLCIATEWECVDGCGSRSILK